MTLNLSNNNRGLIYLLGGAITLLYINGWFVEHLYYIMLTGSISAFIYGFIVTDAWSFIQKLINLFRTKKDESTP